MTAEHNMTGRIAEVSTRTYGRMETDQLCDVATDYFGTTTKDQRKVVEAALKGLVDGFTQLPGGATVHIPEEIRLAVLKPAVEQLGLGLNGEVQ